MIIQSVYPTLFRSSTIFIYITKTLSTCSSSASLRLFFFRFDHIWWMNEQNRVWWIYLLIHSKCLLTQFTVPWICLSNLCVYSSLSIHSFTNYKRSRICFIFYGFCVHGIYSDFSSFHSHFDNFIINLFIQFIFYLHLFSQHDQF